MIGLNQKYCFLCVERIDNYNLSSTGIVAGWDSLETGSFGFYWNEGLTTSSLFSLSWT